MIMKHQYERTKLNNVWQCNLYKEVRNAAYEMEERVGWIDVPEVPDVYVCQYEKAWIAEIISFDDLRRMRPDTPWFIVSQTGTGKTTFIFQHCLPFVNESGKKVAYFCSRNPLKDSIRNIALKDSLNVNIPSAICNNWTIGDMKENISENGLRDMHEFGLIDIYSYQELLYCSKMDWTQYSIVIMDEAHFFLSDAAFNEYTEAILEKIVATFQNARRIYLTATPEESMSAIYEKEWRYLKKNRSILNMIYGEKQTGMYIYLVKEDYQYLSPFFFTKVDEIADKIKNSPEDVRWLIFIRSKEMGKELGKKIGIPRNDITYYDADVDRESVPYYKDLICDENLVTRVTITTKVLDVGVNVKTGKINLVIFEDNPVEIKQMVGRKRIQKDERVNVFFHVPDIGELKKRIARIEQQIKKEDKIIKNVTCSKLTKPEHPVFIIHPDVNRYEVRINNLSKMKHMSDISYLRNLVFLMESGEKEERFVYAEQILDLFSLSYNKAERLFLSFVSDDEKANRLHKVIQDRLISDFDREELTCLAREVRKVLGDERVDKRTDRGEMGMNTLNKVLAPYGYNVESYGNPRQYRIIMRTEENV